MRYNIKYLVTGCYGFIGRKLTEYLLNNNDTVIGLDIFEPSNKISSNNFIFKSFNFDDDQIYSNIDVMYHMSWVGVSTTDKNDYKKQFLNISLTYEALEFAKRNKIKKIVIPGSMSEFSGYNTNVCGRESDMPSDLYAATKVAVRKIAFQYSRKNDIDVNWLLITSIYGPGRKDNNLITSTIKKIINDEKIGTTKLEQKWDYLYIDDLIEAMYLIGKKGKKNKIYPVGSGKVMRLREYVEIIFKIMSYTDYSGIGSIPYKNDFIDNSMPNISELESDTGFKAKVTFDMGIKNVIEEIKREMKK